MSCRQRFLLGLLAGPALALSAGALEWKSKHVQIETTPFQATADARFEFRNTGSRPVTIRDLETSCYCLEADTGRKVYAPGESGVLRATFTVGDRTGRSERTITVVTDEPGSPMQLVLQVDVPAAATLAPRSVDWPRRGAAAEKTVELTAAPGLFIDFTEAVPTNDAFVARLETVEPGRRYRLHLRPRDTAQAISAAIRVFGREKTGHDVVISAYTSVE